MNQRHFAGPRRGLHNMSAHPIQVKIMLDAKSTAPAAVTLRAYDVYSYLYGSNDALITGSRGGLEIRELIAYLYARSFPQIEWDERVKEALRGLLP